MSSIIKVPSRSEESHHVVSWLEGAGYRAADVGTTEFSHVVMFYSERHPMQFAKPGDRLIRLSHGAVIVAE
jgi:hypothetical protein